MHNGRPSRSRLLRTERRGKGDPREHLTVDSGLVYVQCRSRACWEGWTRRRDWSTEMTEPRVRRAWPAQSLVLLGDGERGRERAACRCGC